MDANVMIIVSGLTGSEHVMRPVAEGIAAGVLQEFGGKTYKSGRWALEEDAAWCCQERPGRGRLATLCEDFVAIVRVGRDASARPSWQHDGLGAAQPVESARLDPSSWDASCLRRRSAAARAWAATVADALTPDDGPLWVVEAVVELPEPFARVVERERFG